MSTVAETLYYNDVLFPPVNEPPAGSDFIFLLISVTTSTVADIEQKGHKYLLQLNHTLLE